MLARFVELMKRINLFFKDDPEEYLDKLPEDMRFHIWICDILYAVYGGINFSFEHGYWLANKYAKYVIKRQGQKSKP